MEQEYFEILTAGSWTRDYDNLVKVINQGIDARLTGFTKSTFEIQDRRLYCKIHLDELEIMIRRLLELGNEDAERMANDIVYAQFGVEVY